MTTTTDTETVTKATDPAMEEKIIKLYKQGHSPYKIAEMLKGKITHGGVRNVLLRAGIETRSRSEVKKRYKLDMAYVTDLYENKGWSTYRIGKHLNVPAAVIWYNLDKVGVKTRSLDEAKDPDREVQE